MNKNMKRIKNIWFYYKVPIIIAIIVLAIFIDFKLSSKPEEKYDEYIAFISKTWPSEEEMNEIKMAYETNYQKTFDFNIYNVELGAYGESQETISKLDLDLINNISNYLIIENLDSFKKATNNMELFNVALIKDIDWLKGRGIDNLYFATRK